MKISQLNLFLVILIAFTIVEAHRYPLSQFKRVNEDFCDYPKCSCYYINDTCPEPYPIDCSTTKFCTQPTNKPCCSTDKTFCDYPGCVCVFTEDPCPPEHKDCSDTKYCTLDTNKPCCNGSQPY